MHISGEKQSIKETCGTSKKQKFKISPTVKLLRTFYISVIKNSLKVVRSYRNYDSMNKRSIIRELLTILPNA